MKLKNISINKQDVKNFFLKRGFYIIFVLIFIVYTAIAPNFFMLSNFRKVLLQAAPLMVLASGLTLVIITGSLDISVGSTAFLSAIVGSLLIKNTGTNPVLGIILILLVGMAIGCINGLIIVKLRINPLITTMGMMIALRGFGLYLMKGTQIWVPDTITYLGHAKIGPIYLETVIAILILVIVQIILTRTPFGRHICAIGNDEEAAQKVGIQVKKIKFLVFVISGLFASFGGLLSIAQMGAVTTYLGSGMEFTAIAVVVIGGTSLFGGEGSLLPGTFFGVLLLTLIENGMNLLGLSPFLYPFVRGAIIFLAMLVDSLRFRVKRQIAVINRE